MSHLIFSHLCSCSSKVFNQELHWDIAPFKVLDVSIYLLQGSSHLHHLIDGYLSLIADVSDSSDHERKSAVSGSSLTKVVESLLYPIRRWLLLMLSPSLDVMSPWRHRTIGAQTMWRYIVDVRRVDDFGLV